ncbi:hypothetical protein EDB19DRAFT_1952088 [Suillus lakei]|nr:hypothetical protein EDB19DRAFT_1952088 [Suillus lakei]
MLSMRKTSVVWLFIAFKQVLTAQTPLSSYAHLGSYPDVERDLGQWDLGEAPVVNATGHLVFETANSLLQNWANTRHRIGVSEFVEHRASVTTHRLRPAGHTIVPGTVPVGTLLYHGALTGPHLPTALDWVAVEPDHSIVFCSGSVKTGCWHLTLAVTRPMKVLYFDGSSAVALPEGTMDTQDLVAWSEMKPEWLTNEEQRIKDLCKWGQKYGVNGFVSEIMVCDFTSHMEVVSFLNLESPRFVVGPPTDLPEDPNTVLHEFEIMHSASWRELYPGETRIVLDFSGLVSFYDTALVPSLVAAPRRLGAVGSSSGRNIIGGYRARPRQASSSTVLRVVVDRYASRLEMIQYLSNNTLDDRPIFDHAQQVQRRLRTMLVPYTVLAALPSNTTVTANMTNSWAAPVFRECATSHTASIAAHGTALMPSERLLLQAVQETTREICRVATKMWASGLIAGVDSFYPPDQRPEADHIRTLMGEWREDITKLISWLDWNVWVKCRPACGIEEMCYLPTWPIGFFPTPDEDDAPPFQAQWDSASSVWPDPNKGEWKRPQPKCIRQLEPYYF